MVKSLGEQLDRVQAAIDKLESGVAHSYEIEGRKMTYVDLPWLYKREKYLLDQIEIHGRDYIPGQNAKPKRRSALVSFG
ncbi:MAG: hypothetical protein GXO16_01430 [Epsilonproteobacteria bacterium]|nr:hypothetical protein [Campylobacterota bacterium]